MFIFFLDILSSSSKTLSWLYVWHIKDHLNIDIISSVSSHLKAPINTDMDNNYIHHSTSSPHPYKRTFHITEITGAGMSIITNRAQISNVVTLTVLRMRMITSKLTLKSSLLLNICWVLYVFRKNNVIWFILTLHTLALKYQPMQCFIFRMYTVQKIWEVGWVSWVTHFHILQKCFNL